MMRIKKFVAVTTLLTMIPIVTLAQYDGYDDDGGSDDGYDSDQRDRYDSDQRDGYESSFGNRYEYDLSNPADQIRYEVDPAAQLRDSIDVNPARELEQDMGQYGGGVLDD